jgi:hypothetical protein
VSVVREGGGGAVSVEIVEDRTEARLWSRPVAWRLRALVGGVDVGAAVPAPGGGGWWVLPCPGPVRVYGPPVVVADRVAAEAMLRDLR